MWDSRIVGGRGTGEAPTPMMDAPVSQNWSKTDKNLDLGTTGSANFKISRYMVVKLLHKNVTLLSLLLSHAAQLSIETFMSFQV